MTKMKKDDSLDKLVESKFNGYAIDRKNNSPNARHYVLQKDGDTKHLKVISKSKYKTNAYGEAELVKSIRSDYVVALEDFGKIDTDNVYLLFPHISGVILNKVDSEKSWTDESIKVLISDVVKGLKDIARAGIVHQDIKPSNIIYDNLRKRYVILDLGIALFVDGPNKNTEVIPKGKGPKFYTAPEQFSIAVKQPYSVFQTIDQFSLGTLLYELVTKEHPFINFDENDKQHYANILSEDWEPRLIRRDIGVADETCSVIERMLSKEPSKRYLKLSDLEDGLSGHVNNAVLDSNLYAKMPPTCKDEFTVFAKDNEELLGGVFMSPSDSKDRAQDLSDVGIILDPKTYNLQLNESSEMLSQKLGIAYSSNHNIMSLSRLKHELLDGTHSLSKAFDSSIMITPYFIIDGVGSAYLELTKEIWSEAKSYYADKGMDDKNIYGALIIPQSIIINKDERAKLMSQLLANYQLDGVVVSFENKQKSISTTVKKDYVEGIKELCKFFESVFEDVIVYHTNIVAIPLVTCSSYVMSWSKKSRHLNF